MSLIGQHILSSDIFDRDGLEYIFRLADLLSPVARGEMVCRVLEGAVMGSLFFEASTRTRLSFDSAFMRLGGSVSNTTGLVTTSISKGESLADTSRVISGYFDIIVMRHSDVGSIHEVAQATHIPVINAGNGAGEHPTQALLDMYTLRNEFVRLGKTVDGSRVALLGDLRFGRTVHSLLKLLSLYRNVTIVCVSPTMLAMPEALLNLAADRGHKIEQTDDPTRGLAGADVVYSTRIQRERFPEGGEGFQYGDEFRIDSALVNRVCRADVILMHPLPRDSRDGANDLSMDLNRDERLAIFRQTDAGIPTRMALFAAVLGVADQVQDSLRPARWYRPSYVGRDDASFYKAK